MNIKTETQAGFCDNQPIMQGQSIQSFGVMFVVDLTFTILQVSVNAGTIFNMSCKNLLGQNFAGLLSPEDAAMLKVKLENGELPQLNGWPLTLKTTSGEQKFSASFYLYKNYWIAELEFVNNVDEGSILIARNRLSKLALELSQYDTLQALCDTTTANLKAILGVDKVMIYRFDENWQGTVLSEAKEPEMDAYLDLRFPATDVPEPVRRLYELNPLRMIFDADSAEISIEPALNPLSGDPADMRAGILRGVAPVHLKYMRNMQIAASMSVAIYQAGVLWGLISFHHRSPKTIAVSIRETLKILAECFSARLITLESQGAQEQITGIADFRKLLADSGMRGEFPFAVLSNELQHLSQLLNAQGAAFLLDGQWSHWGVIPKNANLLQLAAWLQNKKDQKVYCTQSLSQEYAEGAAIKNEASGLLAVSITGQFEDMVLWFRPEEEQAVKWGGNPAQTIIFDVDGKNYHPRHSFQIWKESVHLNSVPWSTAEKRAAGEINQMLTDALQIYRSTRLKTLSGLLPICSYCKKIRDEHDSWHVLEEYIQKRSTAEFSHGICPECYKKVMQEAFGNLP